MSNLLHVTRFRSKGDFPLMVEMEVSTETAPYLVTSTKSFTWVEAPMTPTQEMWPDRQPDKVVRVAVRPDLVGSSGPLFSQILDVVGERGGHAKWGNVHPFTEEGVLRAFEHVSFYGLGDLCLLIPQEETTLPLKEIAIGRGLLPQPCSWMPPECAVVVPKDRTFVGVLGRLGRGGSVAVVHNASRAIAIARGAPD